MNLFELFGILQTLETTIRWLREKRLLATEKVCEKCGKMCREGRDAEAVEKVIWRCPDKGCRKKYSVRVGSFFTGSKLQLKHIVTLIYFWTSRVSESLISN